MSIEKPAFKGDDYDFAAGSIKGLRSWNIDDKGRLRGVTHAAVWLPGENVATCRAKTICPNAEAYLPSFGSLSITYRDGARESERAFRKPCGVEGCDGLHHKTTHAFDRDCECGFWAYDEVGYKTHGVVTGVIEGYGRTTIGTKGFRCERARIVALAREDDDNPLSLSRWLRLRELYPEASFHDNIGEMVRAHGAVMRSWPAVDEDFWAEDPDESRERSPYPSLWQTRASTFVSLPPTLPMRYFGGGVA